MRLFNKEADMKCWNCKALINHNEVKWEPRKPVIFGSTEAATWILSNTFRELQKSRGYSDGKADPILVFGVSKFEWRGTCPKCNETQCMFWAGKDSIKSNKERPEPKEPFECHQCKSLMKREEQIWYSYRILQNNQLTEPLVTLCTVCKTENEYPFYYDLEYGIIK
ncbi:MAG: hypothetical protein QXX85_01600 [Candidatus Nitrosotenuis sp.]